MKYKCRDCGHIIRKSDRINTCPSCGSIYLIPSNFIPAKFPKKIKFDLAERFLSLFFGLFAGVLTFFIWGITLIIIAPELALTLPYRFGVYLALSVTIITAITGFVAGEKKLVKLLGILWCTDENFQEKMTRVRIEPPFWPTFVFLLIVIIGSYGYLITAL